MYKRQIHIYPHVSQNEMLNWVCNSDFVVIPNICMKDSFIESAYPNKLGDAIELGKPLILNQKFIFIKSLIDKYHFGLYGDLESKSGMKNALKRVNNFSKKLDKRRWADLKKDHGRYSNELYLLKKVREML